MTDVICVPKFSYIGARNLHTELPGIAALAWMGSHQILYVGAEEQTGAKGLGPQPSGGG